MISHIRLIDDGRGYASRKNDKGGPENKNLFKNVVERTFEFFPDRINILFGPNQCGKTTVLRAIAHSIGIVDGWPKILKYISKEETYEERLRKGNFDVMTSPNTAVIDWDGAPTYYENFRDTMTNRNYGSIGDMSGSLFEGISEIGFIMNKTKISEGQLSMVLLNRLIEKFYQKKILWEDVLRGADKKQIDYFTSFPGAEGGIRTILLDESEKSFDIKLQWDYIYGILPGMREKLGVQLILASHSPFLLSDRIFLNPEYNIISIDPEYTVKVRDLIKKIYEVPTKKTTKKKKD